LGDGSFSKVLSDMVNGVSYTLKVYAVTETAVSDWTDVRTATPLAVVHEGAPLAPHALDVELMVSAIRLNWNRFYDPTITHYKVTVTSPDGQTEIDYHYGNHDTVKLSQFIGNLVSGVTYTFKVQALNSKGYSAFSEPISAIPH
jgi:hypothetical protein